MPLKVVLYFSCHRFSFGNHESHLAVETSPGRSGRFAAARRAADGARASDFAGVERDLEGAATALGNVDGLVVTVPYKARAAAFATRLGKTATAIGAVNALRRERDGRWTGDMFDGVGFVRGAERKGHAVKGRKVALFGAGGAGSAIGCELVAAGAASLAIVDPAHERADALAARLVRAFPGVPIAAAAAMPPGVDMVVNASTIGMREGDGLPADLGALDPGTLVGDVINADAPSPMIRHAMRHGCPYVTGREMFEGQADALMAFFGPH